MQQCRGSFGNAREDRPCLTVQITELGFYNQSCCSLVWWLWSLADTQAQDVRAMTPVLRAHVRRCYLGRLVT